MKSEWGQYYCLSQTIKALTVVETRPPKKYIGGRFGQAGYQFAPARSVFQHIFLFFSLTPTATRAYLFAVN
jgi:hypothetical protein